MFIDKIKSKFRELFPNANLSGDKLQALATRLNKLAKEETDIEGLLNTANMAGDKTFEEQAKEDDAKRNAEAKSKKEAEEAEAKKKAGQEQETTVEEMPAWAKALVESNNSLKTQLAEVQTTSVKEKRTSTFKASIKDLPKETQELRLKNFNRMNFENDEDFNDYITDTTTEVSAHVQTQKDSQSSGYRPQVSTGQASKVTKTELEKAESIVNGMNF